MPGVSLSGTHYLCSLGNRTLLSQGNPSHMMMGSQGNPSHMTMGLTLLLTLSKGIGPQCGITVSLVQQSVQEWSVDTTPGVVWNCCQKRLSLLSGDINLVVSKKWREGDRASKMSFEPLDPAMSEIRCTFGLVPHECGVPILGCTRILAIFFNLL